MNLAKKLDALKMKFAEVRNISKQAQCRVVLESESPFTEIIARLAMLKLNRIRIKFSLTTGGNKDRMNIGKSRLDDEDESWISVGPNSQPVKVAKGQTKAEAVEGFVAEKEAEREAEAVAEEQAYDISVKPTVTHPGMVNAVNDIYRGQLPSKKSKAMIGNGTTMDAARHEIKTGEKVGGRDHVGKSKEMVSRLNNILSMKDVPERDRFVAEALIRDLQNAIDGR